ncbi:DUF2079 domain-containing protein [Actinomadura violacea]|uniref:DUF2079 domain-containing protein n=1 Tax=Actinomadura violacea TaxID=2819934 RepID=A0ABS3RHW1_9ACTN|nr:DUF2079 domain-containing protein [Actinomadura violacea]MBO2456316.1 DUF2079 domain-containing protein [Actinomadura violacea]
MHYNATLMPILFVAFIDAVPRLRDSGHALVRRYGILAPAAVAAIGLAFLPSFPFWKFTDASFYTTSARVDEAHRLMALIPDGASVAASNNFTPQLTSRCKVTLFADEYRRPVDWVIVDSKRMTGLPAPPPVQQARLRALPSEGYRLVRDEDGILLFRRTGPASN